MAVMELRPYQKEAREAVFEQWETVKRTLLVLPTGCGKTVVFAKVAEECVRKGQRVLILAHRGNCWNRQRIKLRKAQGLKAPLKRQKAPAWGAGTGLR